MSKIKLYIEDCNERLDKLIKDGVKVDLIVTDPPYDVSVSNDGGTVNNIKKFKNSLKDVIPISNGFLYNTILPKLDKLQDKTNIYIWCNKKQIPLYFNYYVNGKRCLFDILIWNKTNAMPTYNNKYLTDCEYLLYFKQKGAINKPKNYEDAKTIFRQPINHKDKKIWKHPTIKPLNIIETIIKNSSNENDLVLDPFMGSGTTGVACKNLNRDFIGIEIDEKYFTIAKERIENNNRPLPKKTSIKGFNFSKK